MQDTLGDGGRTASLRDVDGSLSGYPGASLLPRASFYQTPGCVAHPAYGLACPQRYINLEVGGWDWAGGGAPGAIALTRANLSPGRTGAAGLAAQRLPTLSGGQLAPKAGRGGRYFNAAAGVGGTYLVSWATAAGEGDGRASRPCMRPAKMQPAPVSAPGLVASHPSCLFHTLPTFVPPQAPAHPGGPPSSAPAALPETRWRRCCATPLAPHWAPPGSHADLWSSCLLARTPAQRRRPRSPPCQP